MQDATGEKTIRLPSRPRCMSPFTCLRAYMSLLHLQTSPWLAHTTEGLKATTLLVEINDIQ